MGVINSREVELRTSILVYLSFHDFFDGGYSCWFEVVKVDTVTHGRIQP